MGFGEFLKHAGLMLLWWKKASEAPYEYGYACSIVLPQGMAMANERKIARKMMSMLASRISFMLSFTSFIVF